MAREFQKANHFNFNYGDPPNYHVFGYLNKHKHFMTFDFRWNDEAVRAEFVNFVLRKYNVVVINSNLLCQFVLYCMFQLEPYLLAFSFYDYDGTSTSFHANTFAEAADYVKNYFCGRGKTFIFVERHRKNHFLNNEMKKEHIKNEFVPPVLKRTPQSRRNAK